MAKKDYLGGIYPKEVNGQWAIRTYYYRDRLKTVVKGLFDVSYPDDWDLDYLLNLLCFGGYVVITDSPVGVQAFRSSLYGLNYRNNATNAKIAVPLLPEMDRTIGEDCELLFLERMYNRRFFNYNDIINIYAEKLASADCSIDVSLMNSRVGFVAEAETEAQEKTLKAAMDKITEGQPLVVARPNTINANGLQIFFNNLKNNFIAGDVQDVKRTIMNEFLTTIGVNNANTDKKERVITQEVAANNEEIQVNTDLHRENLKRCVERIKAMFGIDFDIKFRFDGRTEGQGGVVYDANGQRGIMGNAKSE